MSKVGRRVGTRAGARWDRRPSTPSLLPLLLLLLLGAPLSCATDILSDSPYDEESEVPGHEQGQIVLQVELEGRWDEVWVPNAAWEQGSGTGGGHVERRNRADGAWIKELRGLDLHGGEQRFLPVQTDRPADEDDGEQKTGPDGRITLERLPPGNYTFTVGRDFYEDQTVEGVKVGFGDKAYVGPVSLRRRRVRVEGSVGLAAMSSDANLPAVAGPTRVVLASRWGYCMMRPVSADLEVSRPAGLVYCPDTCLVMDPVAPPNPEHCMGSEADREDCRVSLCWPATSESEVVDHARCAQDDPVGVGAEACDLEDVWSTESDTGGHFSFSRVPAGRRYFLIASKPGYSTLHAELRCGDWEADTCRFDLGSLVPHDEFLLINGATADDPASTKEAHVAVQVPELKVTDAGWAEFIRLSESPFFPDLTAGVPDGDWQVQQYSPGAPWPWAPPGAEGGDSSTMCDPSPAGNEGGEGEGEPASESSEDCRSWPSRLCLVSKLEAPCLRPITWPEGRADSLRQGYCLILPLRADPSVPFTGHMGPGNDLHEGLRDVFAGIRDRYGNDAWLYRGRVIHDHTRPTLERLVIEEPDGTTTQIYPCEPSGNSRLACEAGLPRTFWTQKSSLRLQAWGADRWSRPSQLALRVVAGTGKPKWSSFPLAYPAAREIAGDELPADQLTPIDAVLVDSAENPLSGGEPSCAEGSPCGIAIDVCMDTVKPRFGDDPLRVESFVRSVGGVPPICDGNRDENQDAEDPNPVVCNVADHQHEDVYYSRLPRVWLKFAAPAPEPQPAPPCGDKLERLVVRNELGGSYPVDVAGGHVQVPLYAGTNSFQVQACDRAGNCSEWTPGDKGVQVVYDNVSPTIVAQVATSDDCTFRYGDTYVSRALVAGACELGVTVTAADNESLDRICVVGDGEDHCGMDLEGNTWSIGNLVETLGLPDDSDWGPRHVEFYVMDKAGNRSSVRQVLLVDHTKPSVSLFQINGGAPWTNQAIVDLDVQIADFRMEYLQHYRMVVTNRTDQNCDVRDVVDGVDAEVRYSRYLAFGLTSGDCRTKSVKVRVCDEASNCSEEREASIGLDTTPPVPPGVDTGWGHRCNVCGHCENKKGKCGDFCDYGAQSCPGEYRGIGESKFIGSGDVGCRAPDPQSCPANVLKLWAHDTASRDGSDAEEAVSGISEVEVRFVGTGEDISFWLQEDEAAKCKDGCCVRMFCPGKEIDHVMIRARDAAGNATIGIHALRERCQGWGVGADPNSCTNVWYSYGEEARQ